MDMGMMQEYPLANGCYENVARDVCVGPTQQPDVELLRKITRYYFHYTFPASQIRVFVYNSPLCTRID